MSEPNNDAVLACDRLSKTFREGTDALQVLDGVTLAVARAERIAIVGASGSGKSTLLHLLGGLDVPSAGTVRLGERVFRGQLPARGDPLPADHLLDLPGHFRRAPHLSDN